MSFLSQMFLWALAAGAAPVLIHLLNRRRYRVMEWAAMDFLREAIHRNRRFLILRDLLLLALRTLAVLLFVLAMARPYRVATRQEGFAGEPVHAVLVMDNSQSMGYTQLDKSLLDVAKEKADAFIRELPKGSKISLVPMCDYAGWHGKDAYSTREGALEALKRIELVDRLARSSEGAEKAARACRAAKDVPTKRVVFIGDMQAESWSSRDLSEFFREIPDVQVVQVSGERRANTWVADLKLRDAVADADSPAVFLATIRHQGPAPRENVRVTLKLLEGLPLPGQQPEYAVVEERRVDLLPDQGLEVVFRHRFDDPGTASKPRFVGARVELEPDHLDDDNHRSIVVPVVAKVPVLFIDQLGRDEKPRLNKYGETFPLRRLLAPRTARQEEDRQLVEVRHRKPDDVTQQDLQDARLVAMAGTEAPTERLVRLLREYVEQGGVLFLAAGGEFDPAAWHTAAWRNGAGILPAPLKPLPIGKLPPPEALDAQVFRLAPATMQDAVFRLDLPPQDLEELFLAPFFYKAVGVDTEAIDGFVEAERERIEARRKWLGDNDENEKRWDELERKGQLTPQQQARREEDREARSRMQPGWLLWRVPAERDLESVPVAELILRTRPRVMGLYDNGEVFAIRRDIGWGRVIMMTSGCFPQWNNLAAEHSVLLLDQALRGLLARSLPKRTFEAVNEIAIPIDSADLGAEFTLRGPGEQEARPIAVEALSENAYGLIVRSVHRRGFYHVTRERSGSDAPEGAKDDGWHMLLAVNGPDAESELASLAEDALRQRMGEMEFRWVEPDGEIRLEGMALIGHNYWKYLMVMAMACLMVETFFLAAPRFGGRSA
ncbi:MAG: BatA domain-containing protein [Phycisphaerae bacterium]